MRQKLTIPIAFLGLALFSSLAWGDQLILRNGQEYSGKFLRGDETVVEFRIQDRVERFQTADVARIVLREPELVTPPTGRRSQTPSPQPVVVTPQNPPGFPPADRGVPAQAPVRHVPPERQPASTVTLAAGTAVVIRTAESIDTERHRVGDTFQATLEEPLMKDTQVLVPRGTEIKGAIAYSQESGRVSGRSELILELTEMTFNGRKYTLRTSDYMEVGASQGKKTAAKAGGGAALGAIIGAIVGGGKGAAIGAATGAAAGAGAQVLTKGQTLRVPAETLLDFKLQHDLIIEVP